MRTENVNKPTEILIRENIKEPNKKQLTFSEFIKDKRKALRDKDGKERGISTRELAALLDIGYEQFRKILNQNKPTKKRDCIIAICAALRLDSEETNDALMLYQYMPTLDAKNPRDDELIEILEEQFAARLSIPEINARLVRNNFPELDIIDRRSGARLISNRNSLPYVVLKKQVRTYADDLLWGDPYNSLMTKYDVDQYRCSGEMWLDDSKDKLIYHLVSSSYGSYSVTKHGKNLSDTKEFQKREDTDIFIDYFIELDSMKNREMRDMLSVLNDTRNYKERVSANIRDDLFYVYAETYNFDVPQLNEYYLYENLGGKEQFSVCRKSEFMRCYLTTERYLEVFGKNPKEQVTCYNSLDELDSSNENLNLLKYRKRIFIDLREKAYTLCLGLKERTIFVQNLDWIFDDRDRVCSYYGVEREFECSCDDEYGSFMTAKIKSADIKMSDGSHIALELDDLYRAFELGFSDIEEICRVKKRIGSINNIIDNFE